MSRYRPVAVVIQLSPEDFGAETFDADHMNYFEKESDGSLRLVHRDLGVGSPSLGARVKHAVALVNYSELRFLRIVERRTHAAAALAAEGDATPTQVLQWDTVPRELGRIMGIALPPNFNLPYTAQSVTEFWQRWHISLSTWLRDYLYIPLGGNRKGPTRTHINLLLTMLLGGLWHGAS